MLLENPQPAVKIMNLKNIIVFILLCPSLLFGQIPSFPTSSAISTKVILIDFDCKTLPSKDTLHIIDEAVAESEEYSVTKAISIINMVVPASYWEKSLNKRGKVCTKLISFFTFPSAKKTNVTWMPIKSNDSLIKKALNCEQVAIENYMNITAHFEVIIKRDGNYYANDGYTIVNNQPFDSYGTYYPNEHEGINCKSRKFLKEEVKKEYGNMLEFSSKTHKSLNFPINLFFTYFANSEDYLTNVVHFDRYVDLLNREVDIYENLCGPKTVIGSHTDWLYFTELDAHEFLGILGGNLFCFGSDGMLPEADRLSRRYYKFKSIGGFTDIRQYYQYYLELGAGRIPRSKKS